MPKKGFQSGKKKWNNMQIPDNIIETAISLKDEYFDLPGLAKYCSLKVPTLRDHIRSGSLPAFKVKGKLLVKRSEFDAWIETFRVNKKQKIDRLVDEVMDSLKGN
jgi:excisionase family DNA binding protein